MERRERDRQTRMNEIEGEGERQTGRRTEFHKNVRTNLTSCWLVPKPVSEQLTHIKANLSWSGSSFRNRTDDCIGQNFIMVSA